MSFPDWMRSLRPARAGRIGWLILLLLQTALGTSAAPAKDLSSGSEPPLAPYLRAETVHLAEQALANVTSLDQWRRQRTLLRQQLLEMLSLDPLPPRTDLKPVVTGRLEAADFTVENLQFQSSPGLYVTGNLYLPKNRPKPAPAILYVCGHAYVMTNGISYGNKTAYQHHGIWFARNGYVCLTIDTVQLGEIQGVHHGTYREGMWWWNSRGYTSAGVETWNCMRALDYLQSRPEVDGDRLGVTGRSGGGAYSWWISAVDDRIKVAAPVAGITDLQNHVVDGTVEGHCDCMFMVNTYRWDYPVVAALVAPRPLLICNSDKDSIFPLDGVVRLHAKVAEIYRLYGATNNLGLLITEGPHKDTQDLQVPVFRWFNRHLKGEDPRIEMAAVPQFTPAQLKVFDQLPADERTSRIHESFVPIAHSPAVPETRADWANLRDSWMTSLRERVFRAWPVDPPLLQLALQRSITNGTETFRVFEFTSEHELPLRLYIRSSSDSRSEDSAKGRVSMTILGESEWPQWLEGMARVFASVLQDEVQNMPAALSGSGGDPARLDAGEIEVVFAPRAVGLTALRADAAKQRHFRRRFMLLGETMDSGRVWDIRRALQALRSLEEFRAAPLILSARGEMAVNALYAGVFSPTVDEFDLQELPASHRDGPDYLNVLRVLDIPQTVALALEHSRVHLQGSEAGRWSFPADVSKRLHWPADRFVP